jgi:hypothetical protein
VQVIPVEDLPGFRRRFRITPGSGSVCCQVEDDYHCMSVVVRHDGRVAGSVESQMHRAPWTTCPGAERQLQETFAGVALNGFATRGGKKVNCTHLYDLALLAANHALDPAPLVYDILVSDPVDGARRAELRRDGETVLGWIEAGMKIVQPETLAGRALLDLQSWIQGLEPSLQEAARLLRWGNILANGRSIPLEQQSDATRMPPNCYTFQPERRESARRVGEIRDFSSGGGEPLAGVRAIV